MEGKLKVVVAVSLGASLILAFIAVIAVRCYSNWRKHKRRRKSLANNSLHMLALSTQPLDFVPLLIQERLIEEGQEEVDTFEAASPPPIEQKINSKENAIRVRRRSLKCQDPLKRRSVSDTSLYKCGERFPDLDPSQPITSLRRESQFFEATIGRGRSLTYSVSQSDGSENEISFGSGLGLDRKPFSSRTLPRQRKRPILARRASEDIVGMSMSPPALPDPSIHTQPTAMSSAGGEAKRSTHVRQRRFSTTAKPSHVEKTSVKRSKRPVKRGQVDFKLQYLREEHKLEVHLINATELPMKNSNLLNAFARITLTTPSKRQRVQSKVHKKTCNPIFDNIFEFDCVYLSDLPQASLKIKLLNKDSISRFERIGETILSLSEEDLLRGETVSRELVDKAKKFKCAGQLLISVCHHATSSQLKTSVMKLKDLPKSTKSIFVTVELTYQGQSLQKHQTKTRKQSICFNEEFCFLVSTDSSCTLENFGVHFTVFQRDFMHGNEVIGHVNLGMEAPLQSEVDHWRAVVLSPHKSIADWHQLHEM